MMQHLRTALTAILVLAGVTIAGITVSAALEAETCEAGDARAACQEAGVPIGQNQNICATLGAPPNGEAVFAVAGPGGITAGNAQWSMTSDGTTIDLTVDPSVGWLGTFVVGLYSEPVPAHFLRNSYTIGTATGLHAPLNSNGSMVAIEKYLLCYYIPEVTTTTAPTTTTTTAPTTTTTTAPTTTTTTAPTTTTTTAPTTTTTTAPTTTTTTPNTTTTCTPYVCQSK